MSNFSEELRDKLNRLVYDKVISDKEMSKLQNIIKDSTTYEDAYSYAMKYGEHLADAIQELGVDTWLFGTAMDTWEPSFKAMASDINKVCETIQNNKNAIEHIGLKPQTAPYDVFDMKDVVSKLTKTPDTKTNIQEYLNSIVDEKKVSSNKYTNTITNYANKRVDKTQRKNMDFLMKSGIPVRVTRIYDGVGLHTDSKPIPCAWCLAKQGTYKFYSTNEASNSGVFARHDGCGCKIDYDNRDVGTRTTSIKKGEWKDRDSNLQNDVIMPYNLQFFARQHKAKKVPKDNPLWDSLVTGDIEQQKKDVIFEWEHGGYDYLIEYGDDYEYNILSKKKKPNIHS